jgi:hypothetical protein
MLRSANWVWIALLILGVSGPLYAQVGEQGQELQLTDECITCIIERLEEQGKLLKGEGSPTRSSIDIQLYGYIKLDASYDTDQVSVGNFARWVESAEGRRRDNQFSMTANQSRIGMKLFGPDYDGIVTSGIVEVDFYGGGGQNKSNPMLRHAYMKIDWVESNFDLIAGQTWDLISPYVLPTLNYPVGWWVGDIGYRRPQVRATKEMQVGESSDLKLAAALSRTIGNADPFIPAYSDTGADSGHPTLQLRGDWSFPLFGEKKTTVGLGGHYGAEEVDINGLNDSDKVESWSIVADVAMPMTDTFSHKAQIFWGRNLDDYLGGIGQGVGVKNGKSYAIRTTGFWYFLGYKPQECPWCFNVGGSVEAMTESQASYLAAVPGAGMIRQRNWQAFGNAIYNITPNSQFGIELSRWATAYYQAETGVAWRIQTSFIFKF